jgi:hypothetical protein
LIVFRPGRYRNRESSARRIGVALVLFAVAFTAAVAQPRTPSRDARVVAASVDGGFIENRGQWSASARYRAVLGRLTAWMSDDGVLLDLRQPGGGGHVVRQRFVDARRAVVAARSRTPAEWTFVRGAVAYVAHGFDGVRYEGVYEGIDLHYYRSDGALKYDIVVAPGADPSLVAMRYDGADRLRVAADGSLRVATSAGELVEEAPVCYQVIDGRRIGVSAAFALDDGVVRFRLGRYDRHRPLVIDPRLAFSTYLGGGANDEGRGIAVDRSSNIYVTGTTVSSDIPTTPGAYRTQPDRNGSVDLFVVKLDPTASVVLYGTYIGGSGNDEVAAMAVNADGSVTIAGTTTSRDFPFSGGADQTALRGASDGFIATLAPSGGALRAATYVGGDGDERIEDVAINGTGDVFVVGQTTSDNLPTTPGSAYPTARGGGDAFAARYPAALSNRTYATYLGGSAPDHALGVALGSGGAANITGWTASIDFPTTAGAAQVALGGARDAFVIRLRFNGTLLEYATYLGGSDIDQALDIAIDVPGNQYIVGLTFSGDLPVSTTDPPGTWFAARVDSSTGSISTGRGYCRYIGPVQDGAATTVQAGATGDAFIAGATNTAAFPTTTDRLNAGERGGFDLALVRLSSDGQSIVHSSVVGGEGDDVPWRQSQLTRFNDLYVTGTTTSARFPTTRNAFDSTLNNNGSTARSDAFALGFRFQPRPIIQSPVRRVIDTVRCDVAARDTFEIFNGGDADLEIVAAQFALATGRFVLETPGQTEAFRLAPGQSRRYIVRFLAPAPGTALDTLLVFSNDSLRNPLRIALHGIRVSPSFPSLPPRVTFATVGGCAGERTERSIVFANAGNEAARVTGARLAVGRAFRYLRPSPLPFSIGIGDAAALVVAFEPQQAGTFNDTLIVTIAGCPIALRVPVTGTADSIGFDIVEAEVDFPALVSCIAPLDTVITIRSTGAGVINVTLDADPGSAFQVRDPLPIRLSAGESRQIAVRYAPPPGPAAAQAYLRLRTDRCARIDSVLLRGERRPGAALDAPDSVAFGTVSICASGPLDTVATLDLVNTSTASVTVDGPSIAAPFAIENGGDFPRVLAAGASVAVRVRYQPAGPGPSSAMLFIPIDAAGCPDTLRVGVGGAAAVPIILPLDTSITVGALPECVADDTVYVPLRNLSGVPIEIDSIASTDGIEYLRPTLSFVVEPGATSTLIVRFAPRRSGPASERLTLFTRGCRDSIVVRLSGTKEGSVVVVEPESIAMPDLLSCALDTVITRELRIRNSGDFAVNVVRASIIGDGVFSLVDDPAGAVIAPGEEIVTRVQFDPVAVGVATARIELIVDPCGDTLTVALTATIVDARLSIGEVSFPSTQVGATSTADMVVTNDLPIRVSIASIGPPPAPFSFVTPPSLPIILEPGASIVLPLQFSPTAVGSYALSMSVGAVEPCAFSTNVALSAEATRSADTVGVCLTGREAGISGDTVELVIATGEHAPLAAGGSIDYAVVYDWQRLEFIDSPEGTTLDAGVPGGVLRLRLNAPTFGPQQARLRFRLLSGAAPTVAVRVDSATVVGDDVALALCADSAIVRIADRCVLTSVSLGRFANRLEPLRPNPARGSIEIVFQQLEDAHTRLAIYDLEGREVLRAVDEPLAGGRYAVRVDLTSIPSGTYLVRIAAGAYLEGQLIVVDR